MDKFKRFVYTSVRLFAVRREERLTALAAFAIFAVLNAMTVARYWDLFSQPAAGGYRSLFVRNFRISGFDPLTYQVVSEWFPAYNIYRHPLLAFFMWPMSMADRGLMALTGLNWATVLTALVLVLCATYSAIFLFRIMHSVVGLGTRQANALCLLYFSFAYVMLASMVPDHFVMSQFCLLLTLWIAGEKLRKKSALNMWQTIVLFIFTAGVSLNNSLKVFLAALVTRRRRFFKPIFLLFAVIVPACLIWWFARWEYSAWEAPRYRARQEQKMHLQQRRTEIIRAQVADSLKTIGASEPDSATIAREMNRIIKQRAIAKYRRDHKQIWNRNKGKPFMKGEFMGWTDKTTSRWDAGVENLFGEGLMLHEDYLLGDVLRNRPVIVTYRNWFNYVVEGIVVLLFLCGIWCGRREVFLWTAMSSFLMDMTLHMGLGFGINEIYIMSPHYLFALPIAIAYLVKQFTVRPPLAPTCWLARARTPPKGEDSLSFFASKANKLERGEGWGEVSIFNFQSSKPPLQLVGLPEQETLSSALTLLLYALAAYMFVWNITLITEYLFFL